MGDEAVLALLLHVLWLQKTTAGATAVIGLVNSLLLAASAACTTGGCAPSPSSHCNIGVELLTPEACTELLLLGRVTPTVQIIDQLVQVAEHRVIIDIWHVGNMLLSRVVICLIASDRMLSRREVLISKRLSGANRS